MKVTFQMFHGTKKHHRTVKSVAGLPINTLPVPILAVAGLLVAALVLLASLAPTPAYATTSPWYSATCPNNLIDEGDSFVMKVRNTRLTGASEEHGETFDVYWSTTAGTAKEDDYTAVKRERQQGTYAETWLSREMSKTFYTTEDTWSERRESFRVWFDPAGPVFGWTACGMLIVDDDGPGAWKTWIDSTPGEDDDNTYGRGDTIRIKQQFTEDVTVTGEVNVGIQIGGDDSEARRSAAYVSGSGTNTLTFGYTVAAADEDRDGISINASDYGGSGSIATEDDSAAVNSTYKGAAEDSDQQVSGKAHVETLSIVSTPAGSDTYRAGEVIEFELEFDRNVEVDGQVLLGLRVGEGDDTWRGAVYDSGTDSDTLVFKYTVQGKDLDTDGILVINGAVDSEGTAYGFGGTGSITDTDDLDISLYYTGLTDQESHKLDGRPYVTGLEITSTPPNGTHYRIGDSISFIATFDQAVSATSPLSIPIAIGDGTNTETWTASYSSTSEGNKLVFTHQVGAQQRDDDGISISEGRRILESGTIYASGTTVAAIRDIPALPDQAGQKVYGFLPSVSANAITSTPATGDTYWKGETIEISLTFYYAVEVQDTPAIKILLGPSPSQRSATYSSGSGTNTLKFNYVVQASDADTDGVGILSLPSGGFNGGNIKEPGTSNFSRGRIPGLDNQASHKVAGSPYVTAAAITSTPASNGTYVAGETIGVSLTFDRAVDVEGEPTLKLTIGDNEREADYESGTGTATLVFEYVVQSGDEDTDGITVTANGLVLNDGGIEDEDDTAANLTIAAISVEDQLVDAVAPAFVSAVTSTDGNTVTITFSEDVDISGSLRTLSTFAGVDASVYLQVLVDVFADDHRMHITNAEISDEELALTLDSAITQGHEVKVSYDNSFTAAMTDLLVDDSGNGLGQFSAQSVTNNSTVADDSDSLWPVLSSHSLTVSEGGTSSYTVKLDSQPDEDVTVSLAISPSGSLTADASQLIFTTENWDTAQTVSLTAGTDEDSHDSWQEITHTSDAAGFVTGHLKVLVEE